MIQTQLLKLYFLTTLYVDVKEPAFTHIPDHKKTQSRADKNHSLPAVAGFRFRCRDKIEPNLQSQNVRRTHSKLVESRFQRDKQNITFRHSVKCANGKFSEINAGFYTIKEAKHLRDDSGPGLSVAGSTAAHASKRVDYGVVLLTAV